MCVGKIPTGIICNVEAVLLIMELTAAVLVIWSVILNRVYNIKTNGGITTGAPRSRQTRANNEMLLNTITANNDQRITVLPLGNNEPCY